MKNETNETNLYGGSHTVSTGVRFYSVRFYYARMSSVHSVSAIIIPWCARDSARTLGMHVAATDIASLDGNGCKDGPPTVQVWVAKVACFTTSSIQSSYKSIDRSIHQNLIITTSP